MTLADEALSLPDGLDKLLQIQYVLGYGDGKISDTHIRDTPTQNKLTTERDRLSNTILKNLSEYERLREIFNKYPMNGDYDYKDAWAFVNDVKLILGVK